MIIAIVIIAFCFGIIAGWCIAWWYMESQWQRNPYKMKAIVDGVIAMREEREARGEQ